MTEDLSYSQARSHLREVLDDAERGRMVKVRRGATRYAVTDATRLRDYFAKTTAPRLRLIFDDDVWVASMDRRPFVSEGRDIDSAIDDLVESLREYAEDWEAHLQHAPNHRDAWGLVQLIGLSTDADLRAWLRSEAPGEQSSSSEAISRQALAAS